MRRDDPKRIAAEKNRDQAQCWLQILCKGLGQSLVEAPCRYGTDEVRHIIGQFGMLAEAVDAAEHAEKAYEPYWRRRRRRRVVKAWHRVRPRKRAKAAKKES